MTRDSQPPKPIRINAKPGVCPQCGKVIGGDKFERCKECQPKTLASPFEFMPIVDELG